MCLWVGVPVSIYVPMCPPYTHPLLPNIHTHQRRVQIRQLRQEEESALPVRPIVEQGGALVVPCCGLVFVVGVAVLVAAVGRLPARCRVVLWTMVSSSERSGR